MLFGKTGEGGKGMGLTNDLHEYEPVYENRTPTTFALDNGVKIIGFVNGDSFDLRVLTIGPNPRRNGYGQNALKFLRPRFKKISVSEIRMEALPFWVKMKERGLVDHLVSVKEGKKLHLIDQTGRPEAPVKKPAATKSKALPDSARCPEKSKMPERREFTLSCLPYLGLPPDPELENVCVI